VEMPLTDYELKRFDECCQSIRTNMALADELIRGKGAKEN
jgi:hypothetical protein